MEAVDKSSHPTKDVGNKPKKRKLILWIKRFLMLALFLTLVSFLMIWYANYAATRAGKGLSLIHI